MTHPTFRVTTVQFAVPHDDPCFRLTELHDLIQERLYDGEGMAGSFKIIGTLDIERSDYVAEEAFNEGRFFMTPSNALRLIEEETVENAEQNKCDLIALETWAKMAAASMVKIVPILNDAEKVVMRRLYDKGLVKQPVGYLTITQEGYRALGWIPSK